MKTAKLKEAIKRHIQYWTKNEDNQTKHTTHKTKNTPAHQNYLYYALGILN